MSTLQAGRAIIKLVLAAHGSGTYYAAKEELDELMVSAEGDPANVLIFTRRLSSSEYPKSGEYTGVAIGESELPEGAEYISLREILTRVGEEFKRRSATVEPAARMLDI